MKYSIVLSLVVLLAIAFVAIYLYRNMVADYFVKLATDLTSDETLPLPIPMFKENKDKPQQTAIKASFHGGQTLAGLFNLTGGDKFKGLSLLDAQILFARFCTNTTGHCLNPVRFGKNGDGGYEVCMSKPYTLIPGNCIVYSFGIGNMWGFDDALQELGCKVHSFDPSIHRKDHVRAKNHNFYNVGLWGSDTVNKRGWKLNTLSTIVDRPGHTGKVIDVMKIDIEGAEWPALKQILTTNVMKFVKQLIFEIHTPVFKGSEMTVTDYASIYNDLTKLTDVWGFKLYLEHHANNCCKYGDFATLTPNNIIRKGVTLCCYELYFINSNYH